MLPVDFPTRLQKIQENIHHAAARSGRDASAITLIAVTKNHPASLIESAYQAGLRTFGENRVAEMLSKQQQISLSDINWHFIGHLQRRKARQLIGKSTLTHSVDRLSLARELSKRAVAAQTNVSILLQINSSGEATKGGWHVARSKGRDAFLHEVEEVLSLPALQIKGLMTMAPFYQEAEQTRPTFAITAQIQQTLQERFPNHSFAILSMGMSNDYQVAIEEGATHIRLGTALFGARDY